MENIWAKLHPLMENERVEDLDDCINISNNDMLVAGSGSKKRLERSLEDARYSQHGS